MRMLWRLGFLTCLAMAISCGKADSIVSSGDESSHAGDESSHAGDESSHGNGEVSQTNGHASHNEATHSAAPASRPPSPHGNHDAAHRQHGQGHVPYVYDKHRDKTSRAGHVPNQAKPHETPSHGKRNQPPEKPRQPTIVAVIETDADADALAIFQRRILPIFQSAKPSSCTECHLSGVDLKEYIHPSQEKTFAALVQGGLIDVKTPLESKILRFIARKPEKPSLITEKIRNQEYAAFRAWIEAAVKDRALLAAPVPDALLGPSVPDEVVRHARVDRVLASFIDNVWSEVGRCAACHSPDRNQKQVAKHGEQVSWIKLRDPRGTMDYMIEAGLIDPLTPEDSLLLLKPTLQVKHGGGQKMVVGDRTYKQFRRFIDDYSAVVEGKYQKADQLPEPSVEVAAASEVWLKITGVPKRFDKMLLQADVYRKAPGEGGGWSKFRWATSDRPVAGNRNLWQHSLSVTAPRDSARAKEIRHARRLPPGRYLIKLYIDQAGKLQKDYQAELGEDEFVGQVELESRWTPGYGRMTVVAFPTD